MRNKRSYKINGWLTFSIIGLAIFAANCLCQKTIHNEDSRPIPKYLVVGSNLNEVAPSIGLMIRVSFKSLPKDWYCQHYGGGAGTMPWYIEDTFRVNDISQPVTIALRLNKKTYCPYILHGVFLSLLQSSTHRPNPVVSFWSKEENPDVKWNEIPVSLNLNFVKDSLGYFFPEYSKGLLHFLIPENGKDSLSVHLDLHKVGE